MKKIFALLMAVVMCFSLVGCNDAPTEDTLEKTASISPNYMNIAVDENYIYFVDAIKIKKMNRADETVTELYTFDADKYQVPYIHEYFDGRLYITTTTNELFSMDTNGENVLSAKLPEEIVNRNIFVSSNTTEKRIYLSLDVLYQVNPQTLEMTPAEYSKSEKGLSAGGYTFESKIDGMYRSIYRTDANGETVLFTGENEGVWLTDLTNNYLFYAAWEKGDSTKFRFYRIDLNGDNKTLIRELPLDDYTTRIRFDDRYVYMLLSENELIKIDKETLAETDISVSAEEYYFTMDICDGRMFETFGSTYYVDLDTGEKVNLSSYYTDFGIHIKG